MKQLLKGLLGSLAVMLLKRYQRLSLDMLRIQAALGYVKCVRTVRSGFLAGVLLACCLMVAGSGFVLFHVGLLMMLPGSWRAAVLMALGAFYMLVVLLILRWLCSEKTWMKFSKAGEFVEKAIRKNAS